VGDIVLIEGNNELNVAMTPIAAIEVGPVTWDEMPPFEVNSSHVAKVVFTNPTPIILGYEVKLLMGIDKVEMARQFILLNAGVSIEISFSVVMPDTPGEYPVYILVNFDDTELATYQDESITIIPPDPLTFDMVITSMGMQGDKYMTAYWVAQAIATISNPHDVTVTHVLRTIWANGDQDNNNLSSYSARYWRGNMAAPRQIYLTVTLDPGQSIEVVSPFYYMCHEWNLASGSYEWSNVPNGTYRLNEPKLYWYRIIDENNNWSPVESIGEVI